MTYKDNDYHAHVERECIIFNGEVTTPAQMANSITGSSRNAWRDLWIRLPGDDGWRLANNIYKIDGLEDLEEI